jgi:hypothetical protein
MNIPGILTQLSYENVAAVARSLRSHGGFLLTWEGALNWRYTVTLYDHPEIKLKQLEGKNPEVTIVNRHKGGNATNPLDDREYRFGKVEEKKGLCVLFDSFDTEHYRVSIGPEWGICSWPKFEHFTYLYLPKREDLPEAFKWLIREVIVSPDLPISVSEVEGMVEYIMEDLRTKAVVRKTVSAGVMADAACGFG